MYRIRKGLDLPIEGSPSSKLDETKSVGEVAILGSDYVNMRPTMLVKIGDQVKIGQPIFECKRQLGVIYTAPAAGEIIGLNRGQRRVFQSVAIRPDDREEQIEFTHYQSTSPENANENNVRNLLLESGLWSSFRTRPYSKNPSSDEKPNSIFVNSMDTNPLALDPMVVISQYAGDFANGLQVISKLTDGTTFVCHQEGKKLPTVSGNIQLNSFSGPHPSGNAGTHIHFLDPVSANKTVWTINYQDVIAIGKLFTTGRLWVERIISMAGPQIKSPRLIKTRLGASINDLVSGELLNEDNVRVISGSVLSGFEAKGPFAYLGRYHNQISALEEGHRREFLGWAGAGGNKFSIKPSFVSSLSPSKKFSFTTSTEGSFRAMIPTGNYEKVMPLDILPTQLLRALITKQTDLAQQLGCLELEEEDLALCTFVDHGKVDYGPILRENLTQIDEEG